jgi:hypothetical protein
MTAAQCSALEPSSKRNPCPICGRTADGDCRTSDGLSICHHGSTHHPPGGLRRGEVIEGHDGQRWAFTGETTDGRGSTFTLDKPRHQPARVVQLRPRATSHKPAPAPIAERIELARLPQPSKEPPAHLPDGQRIKYSQTQSVVVLVGSDGKRHIPHHVDANGMEVCGAGPELWPLYRKAEALEHGPGRWIIEAEGEKCTAWLRAGGLVAVSQPGHDHKAINIERRYRGLVEASVAGVIYLADHDKTGREKAERCAAAAAAVGLQLVVVHASDVWPDLPPGGSIDDAPGTAAERVAAMQAAIPAAAERYQDQPESEATKSSCPLSIDEVKDRLHEAISEGIGAVDLAALIADLVNASDLGAIHVERLAAAIRAEHLQATAIAVEAQQFAAEADRQEIGQVLTASYLLPPTIAEALELRTAYLPCEGPSVVIPFLATVAGLVKLGTRVEAFAVAGYDVPVNVFACLVGDSGQKKSPVGKLTVDEPTRDLRAEMAAANRAAIEDWREECRQTKKGGPKPDTPKLKRLMVSDFTGEALADQLQTQEEAGLGLLIHRDEIRGMFASLNSYRGGKGGDEEQLLELFDGGGCNSLRVTSGGRFYSRSQVSIYGTTQPEVLRELVAKGDANGLWARFLFVPLPSRAIPLPLSSTDEEKGAVVAAAKTLADTCRAVYRLPPKTYKLASQAAQRFQHFEHCRQLASQKTTIGAQGALYGKSAGKVLRLAGVLHLLEIATQQSTSSARICVGTMDRAIALVDHLDAWALSLHAEVAAGGVGQLMRTVHRAAEAAAEPIRWRELARRLSTKQRDQIDAAGFAQAARALAVAGYGDVEEGKRGAISYRATRALP